MRCGIQTTVADLTQVICRPLRVAKHREHEPMPLENYSEYDGLGLAELVKNKDVTPSELTEEAIARIEKHNPALNGVIFKAYDQARSDAKAGKSVV